MLILLFFLARHVDTHLFQPTNWSCCVLRVQTACPTTWIIGLQIQAVRTQWGICCNMFFALNCELACRGLEFSFFFCDHWTCIPDRFHVWLYVDLVEQIVNLWLIVRSLTGHATETEANKTLKEKTEVWSKPGTGWSRWRWEGQKSEDAQSTILRAAQSTILRAWLDTGVGNLASECF
jgi:hypothetical protein